MANPILGGVGQCMTIQLSHSELMQLLLGIKIVILNEQSPTCTELTN